jgi:AIG2-like family
MLYFAYGSNMHRDVMATHAPNAVPLGVGALANYAFVITADGYASIEPKQRRTVYGVLWRIESRDRVRLDAWENVAGGLYRAEILPVQHVSRRYSALTYTARQRAAGRAKAGYVELLIAASLEWQLPAAYIEYLRRFLPKRPGGVTWRSLKEYGWT